MSFSNGSSPGLDSARNSDASLRAPAEDSPSFLTSRRIKRELLQELNEPSGPTDADLADLLGRWPGDKQPDPDVAGLLFQDFRNRSLRGEPVSGREYSQRFPEHEDSLGSLIRRQDFVRSMTNVSEPSFPTLALPQVGDELFGFRLREPLGRGAFARVFLAEQSDLADRPVVLKISDVSGSEPQTLAQLQHTHIVPIHSVHEDHAAGIRAVCMPYFGGASLSQVLRAAWEPVDPPTRGADLVAALCKTQWPTEPTPPNPPLARGGNAVVGRGVFPSFTRGGQGGCLEAFDYPHACCWIIARLAEGLQHAHDRGVLHRDIKPSNILIGNDGTPMLLDFNLAHDDNQNQAQVEATLGGTVAYMAPEHLRAVNSRNPESARKVDQRSDLYGLGMVLFEMLTGHNPFEQSISYSPMPILVEAMVAERSRCAPSLRQFRPDASWGLESIVRKCLQPDPAQRYQRADHLAEDLQRLLDDRPLKHAPELSRAEQIRKWVRRHPRVASSCAVALAASLLLAAGAVVLHETRTRLEVAQADALAAAGAEAQQLKRQFTQGTLRALCLVNTHSELQNHALEGQQVCEQTLALFDIRNNADWQRHPLWQRLHRDEQLALAEDARELLLLLAGTRVRLADSSKAPLRDALALLDRAESIRGLNPSAAVMRAKATTLRLLGDSPAAEQVSKQADALPATTARDHYLLATELLQSGTPDRHARAIQQLDQALKLDARHYWSWMQKGLCHWELGEPHQALADFGVCVGLWPEFPWGYFNRGFTLDQLGHKSAAIADYSVALERDSTLAVAVHNRGVAHLELRQFALALADLDRLVELGRRDPVVSALRGQALEGLHRGDEADAEFAAMFADFETLSEPVSHQILCAYAFAVADRLPDRARQAFERIPPRSAKSAEALYGLAMLAAHEHREERSIELLQAALDQRPEFEAPRRFRAVLLARQGQVNEAIADINAALQLAPQSGPTLYAAACVTALASQHAPNAAIASQAERESLTFLRRALDRGYGQHADADADLASLRRHPEFMPLLRSYTNRATATGTEP